MYISAVKLFESKYEKKKSIYLSKICSLAVVATCTNTTQRQQVKRQCYIVLHYYLTRKRIVDNVILSFISFFLLDYGHQQLCNISVTEIFPPFKYRHSAAERMGLVRKKSVHKKKRHLILPKIDSSQTSVAQSQSSSQPPEIVKLPPLNLLLDAISEEESGF